MTREFEDTLAVRERVPMLVGLVGPSGSGKTYSALRLATGMQRRTGGGIFYIDTEARRALHYADEFDFRHVEMGAPFSPQDYVAAVRYSMGKGAGVLIVDSLSHEHEGPGGVLEMHDAELDRMAGDDDRKRQRLTFSAWAKPKAQRRQLINAVLRMGVHATFCFRAKEKLKIVAGQNPLHLGWQPIAGDEFIYEMTIACLLYPGAEGVPNWAPDEKGERVMLKRPAKLAGIFRDGEPLSEDTGEGLAKWAEGDTEQEPAGELKQVLLEIAAAPTIEAIDKVREAWTGHGWSASDNTALWAAMSSRREEVEAIA